MNVIDVAIEQKVEKIVSLSTDKACNPINLYGATKLASDKLFIAANNLSGNKNCRFSVVRYGNVMGSRGSVIPYFLEKIKNGVLPITDKRMTRFNITLQEGVDFVLERLIRMWGGELFVPKIPSYKILDVAKAIAPDCKHEIVGIRPGEKLHEEMITVSDSPYTVDLGKYYAILSPTIVSNIDDYCKDNKCLKVPDGFSYSSRNNEVFLSIDEIRELIRENVDPLFSPE